MKRIVKRVTTTEEWVDPEVEERDEQDLDEADEGESEDPEEEEPAPARRRR